MLLRQCWRRQISAFREVSLRHYASTSSNGLKLDLGRPVQSYISQSRDPYINLSIEHHLLQKSSPESVILLLYVNRPSIILGRNQNPWFEVNLGLLSAARSHTSRPQRESPGLRDVDLVRRRSGGGTVFHDEGNVNWTVICPSSTFTRDKHAELVVRALRNLDVSRSRVNERHDIVLDQGTTSFSGSWGPEDDTHSTPWQTESPRSLKVSGSAYKLTRQRALHHGTALLNSPNLNVIPHYLHSPAKLFIKGRGVESVSSPVGNILLSNEDFIEEVQREFRDLYGGEGKAGLVGEEWLGIEEVEKGWKEIKSHEWTYTQTPQFTLSNQPGGDSPMQDKPLIDGPSAKIHMDVKHGMLTNIDLVADGIEKGHLAALSENLDKRHFHEICDWPLLFKQSGLNSKAAIDIANWIGRMLPAPK